MIEFEKALKHILNNTKKLACEKVSLYDSAGRILMEDIYSDIEMPPFDKSAMDGYAVRAEDIKDCPVKLRCIGFIEAGGVFRKKIGPGECIKIMTGASLPRGADSVVMVENTRRFGEYVEIEKPVERRKNVCLKGEDIKRGQKVLNRGTVISTSDISLLATVGKDFVEVTRRPKVAVLNTGGEIVPVGCRLSGAKIYNSNGPQLVSLLKSDGMDADFLGIAKDVPRELTKAVKKGLESDVLLISGGVSMGDYDLVPGILKKSGVREIFHKVRIKPGKPLFFGTKKGKIIFGIPGNPVSNFLAYCIFIRPALYKMMGNKECGPRFEDGIMERELQHKTGRKHFIPAKVSNRGVRYYVSPVRSHGSADILALSRANSFIMVDADRRVVPKRSKVKFIRWIK